ncbi:GNAT family N-acetyltransferase [Candidatus Peregrinibacteria bacterium]|nr:GNAT family N-acetyltransferase [Candidatus Peregrinibacteria bacterium]
MYNPFLIGKKLYLRIIEPTDLNEVYEQWFNNEEVCQFNSHHRFPHYLENLKEYYEQVIKTGKNVVLAIIDKKTNQHIGNISLQDIDYIDRSADLSIIIGNKAYWKKGVGNEACKLLLHHGFSALNLHRITCGTSVKNIGMQKLAEQLGFIKEGIFREALYKNGAYEDILKYGLLVYEYKEENYSCVS